MNYINANKKSYEDVYAKGWGNKYPDSNIVSYYFNYIKPLLMENRTNKCPLKMLDFGCSLGANTRFFEEQGYTVYGIDISPLAIEKCVKINNFNKDNFKALNILEDGLEIEHIFNTKFDLIVASEVLYYLSKEDGKIALEMFENALNVGGVIYANWVTFNHDVYRKFEKNDKGQLKIDVTGSMDEALNVYVIKDKEEMKQIFSMFEIKHIKSTMKELIGMNESLHCIGIKRCRKEKD